MTNEVRGESLEPRFAMAPKLTEAKESLPRHLKMKEDHVNRNDVHIPRDQN